MLLLQAKTVLHNSVSAVHVFVCVSLACGWAELLRTQVWWIFMGQTEMVFLQVKTAGSPNQGHSHSYLSLCLRTADEGYIDKLN